MTPPQPPERSASWFDRLVALGNHNRIIAIATLVTLATGVPYLAVSAWSALTGEERPTMEELIASHLAEAIAQVDAQAAEKLAVGAEGVTRTRIAQERALETVAASARGATPEEQNAVIEALMRFNSGDAAPALAKLSSIARAQEARGDLDAAAETWCRRGYLQVFVDADAALADFERADDLSSSGIDVASQIERGRLLRYAGRFDDAALAYRVAIRQAERDGDDYGLCLSLYDLGKMKDTSWDLDPGFQAERHAANLRAMELAAQLRQDPAYAEETDLIGIFGGTALVLGGGIGVMHPTGHAVATPDSVRVADVLRVELESLRGDKRLAGPDRDFGIALVAGALGYTLEALDSQESDIADAYALAAKHGRRALEGMPDSLRLRNLQMPMMASGKWSVRHGLTAQGVDAFAVNLGVGEMLYEGAMDSGPGPSMVLGGMIALHSWALIADGDREAGLAGLDETWRLAQRSDELAGKDPGMAAGLWEVAHILALYGQDDDRSRAWISEADRYYAERVVGTRFEDEVWGWLNEDLLALRTRLGFQVPQ